MMHFRIINRFTSLLCLSLLLFAVMGTAYGDEIPVTTQSQKALVLFTEGKCSYNFGNLSKAIEKFEQALELDDNFGLAWLYLSEVLRYQDSIERADKCLEKAGSCTGLSKAETALIRFAQAGRINDRGQQKEQLDILTELYPDHPTILTLTGVYYSRQRTAEKARDYLQKAVQQVKSFDNYRLMGNSYWYLRDFGSARLWYEKMRELSPDEAWPAAAIGYTYYREGQFEEAMNAFENVQKIHPYHRWALSGLGDTYLCMDKPEKARMQYNALLENATSDEEKRTAYYGLVGCCACTDQIDSGLQELEKLVDMFMASGDQLRLRQVYGEAGNWLMYCNRVDEAKIKFDQEMDLVEKSDLSDGDKQRRKANVLWNMVRVALRKHDLEKAKELDQEIVQLEQQYPDVVGPGPHLKATALIALEEGRYEDALTALNKVSPTGGAWRKARVYEAMGDVENAKLWYEKVISSYNVWFPVLAQKNRAREKLASLQ